MKIGLFVTGHFRTAPKTHENYSQFLDGHDTSVFVGTWTNKDIDRYTHQVDYTPVDVEGGVKAAFGSSLKGLWIGDTQAFFDNKSPAPGCPPRILWNDCIRADKDPLQPHYPNPQRSLDQWYAVLQTYLLAEDVYDTFDVVIRIRSDQVFLGKPRIPFDDVFTGIHVNGYTWWHNPNDREHGTLNDSTNLTPYALSDQLAWGTPYWMRKYFEYYLNWPKIWPGRLTVWSACPRWMFDLPNSFLYNTEHMMAYYLLKFPYYNFSKEKDMPWHRHGHDDNPHNRFDSDFYTWG